jgi:hypothetical protein
MLFRYDFGIKLDLSRFRKSAAHYIASYPENRFEIFINHFLVEFSTEPWAPSDHFVRLRTFDITKDADGIVIKKLALNLLTDSRFNSFPELQKLYSIHSLEANFRSVSAEVTVDKICKVITLLHKISNLRAFV